MSRRRELDQHRRQLGEIAEIMRSMKSLAYMETRKLSRLLETQGLALAVIDAAAADFLAFHPALRRSTGPLRPAVLAIGAERGFCGDFNDALVRAIADHLEPQTPLIAVGARLCSHLQLRGGDTVLEQGPGTAEEVPAVLNRVVTAISRLQERYGGIALSVWCHRNGLPTFEQKRLLPPFAEREGSAGAHFGHAPLLNLPPQRFFGELVDQYLLAVLHEVFYASLLTENLRRVQHLEAAVRRLDDKQAEYARQSRILRQEEITEEIEVILLSAERVGSASGTDAPSRR